MEINNAAGVLIVHGEVNNEPIIQTISIFVRGGQSFIEYSTSSAIMALFTADCQAFSYT